ncbi:MAG: hypothetical protein QXG71_01430 [Nanopusillaceae archaeon]
MMFLDRLKELIKDIRVIVYLVSVVVAMIYLIYSASQMKIVVEDSPIIPKGTIIYSINDCKINNIQDFYSCIPEKGNIIVSTDKGNYLIEEKELYEFKEKTIVTTTGNIKFGIDIGGGYMIVLKSLEDISKDQLYLAQKVLEKRLNTLGLKSLNIYTAGDKYIVIQVPTTEKRLIDVIKQQGYFEAKIMNLTVFTGLDIINVLTNPGYAGLEGCEKDVTGWHCSYYFTLILSKDAARRFANITKDIPLSLEFGGRYLKEKIYFYLDGELVSDLLIDANLRGVEATQVLIKVSGSGNTQKEASGDALNRASNLQIVLGSGSLPSKFEIEQISYISPQIAGSYIRKILFAAFLALIILATIVFIIFRNVKASLLIYLPMISEVMLAVAIAIAVGQTLDVAAILGVFLGIATGMDDNLIIVNDVLRGKREYKVEKSIKKVLFIVFTAIFTEIIAFVPMLHPSMAFGLFRGFAFMTIVTALVGYFITRPAYVKLTNFFL